MSANPNSTSIITTPTYQFTSRGRRYAPQSVTCKRCSAVSRIIALAPVACRPRMNQPSVTSCCTYATDAQAVVDDGA